MKFTNAKYFKVTTLALVAVICLVPSVPIAAESENSNTFKIPASINLSNLERQYLTNTSKDIRFSKEGHEQAEKYRLEAVKLAEEGIKKEASKIQYMRKDTVYLGADKTIYNADWGLYWSESWGGPLYGDWYSTSYLESNKAEAIALLGGASIGGVAGISWIGTQFVVSGSGSHFANIYMTGNYEGYILAIAAPGVSASVDIYLVVVDDTTNTEYSTVILSESTGLGAYDWGESFNKGLSIVLQAGHEYSIYLSLTASSGLIGLGAAWSDWGRFDDVGEYARWSSIVIDF